MAYRVNPFLERRSERATSDQEFVRLFSPRIFDRLKDSDYLASGLHLFKSPPGGGKTTILRAFTPNVLRSFYFARAGQPESYRHLADRGALDDKLGPQILGVLLSCAAGYADLPPGAASANDGLFRALFDCRVVLRTLRGVLELVGQEGLGKIEELLVDFSGDPTDVVSIPRAENAVELADWAVAREREIYDRMEAGPIGPSLPSPSDVRFDSVLWLQSVRFVYRGNHLECRPLLMIDDVHKLRRHQRDILIDELATLRPSIPVWLAGRSIAFADEFLSQGSRLGRDITTYALEEMWTNKAQQYGQFAENVIERRFDQQTDLPKSSFNAYLSVHLDPEDVVEVYGTYLERFDREISNLRDHVRYTEWISSIERNIDNVDYEDLVNLVTVGILISRDLRSRQMSLDLTPLTTEEFEEKDRSALRSAAEIFIHEGYKLPFYFGIDKIVNLSTGNIEELLALAAALFEGMKAKQVVRRLQPSLSPADQEKRLLGVIQRRTEFIPSSHTEGHRALKLLGAVSGFCRERTFLPNAPYAPGVTGVRLSYSELQRFEELKPQSKNLVLKRVLAECVAENLLNTRDSKASASREAGTVFYLNRSLCAHFGLPLQYGGWQEVTVSKMVDWMETGYQPGRSFDLGIL